VNSPEVLIRRRVGYGATCPKGGLFCDRLQIRYNLEGYFFPEGEGRKLEQVRNERSLTVVAAVAPSGRAAIKRMMVGGEPVYDGPWFQPGRSPSNAGSS
jgi:GDYXXLXY protein